MLSEKDKDVEELKEFMTILTEVKVTLAEQSAKLDNLLDMKEEINKTSDIAKEAKYQADQNTSAIEKIQNKVSTKASKEDVEKIVKQRENTFKNLPSWIALLISLAVFVLTYVVN